MLETGIIVWESLIGVERQDTPRARTKTELVIKMLAEGRFDVTSDGTYQGTCFLSFRPLNKDGSKPQSPWPPPREFVVFMADEHQQRKKLMASKPKSMSAKRSKTMARSWVSDILEGIRVPTVRRNPPRPQPPPPAHSALSHQSSSSTFSSDSSSSDSSSSDSSDSSSSDSSSSSSDDDDDDDSSSPSSDESSSEEDAAAAPASPSVPVDPATELANKMLQQLEGLSSSLAASILLKTLRGSPSAVLQDTLGSLVANDWAPDDKDSRWFSGKGSKGHLGPSFYGSLRLNQRLSSTPSLMRARRIKAC